MFYKIAAALLGYCLAAMFSSNVFITPSLTAWDSVWTWIVLLFWWVIGYWTLIPVLGAIAISGFFGTLAIGAAFVATIFGLTELSQNLKSKINQRKKNK